MTPTDIYRYSSSDLVTWTQDPVAITFPRYSGDEGVGFAGGQVADPHLVEVNGWTYMYYDAFQNQADGTGIIKLAIAPETIDTLVTTSEGRASGDPAPQALASGSVTLANLRLSAINGTAFVDFSAAGTLTPYVGCRLVLTDSGGKSLTGIIKAAGTGETYGPELITNGNMELDAEWIVSGTSTAEQSTTQAHSPTHSWHWTPAASGDGIRSSTNFTVTANKCYKIGSFAYTDQGAFNWNSAIMCGVGNMTILSGSIAGNQWVDQACYRTSPATNASTYYLAQSGNRTTGNFYLDDASLKQVLTPSTTGVTIVSYFGGNIFDWQKMDSGFTLNDASNYTYAIYPGYFAYIANIPNVTTYYKLADGQDAPGAAGVYVEGAGQTLLNIDAARCPAGGYVFMETATLANSIGVSAGNDITIAAGKTVTGTYNLFGDSGRAGTGTYSDAGSTTIWSSDPLFLGGANFRLRFLSPAKNAGDPSVYATISGVYDLAEVPISWTVGTDIGELSAGDIKTLGDSSDYISFEGATIVVKSPINMGAYEGFVSGGGGLGLSLSLSGGNYPHRRR